MQSDTSQRRGGVPGWGQIVLLAATVVLAAVAFSAGWISSERLVGALRRIPPVALTLPLLLVMLQRLLQLTLPWVLFPWQFGLRWSDVGRAWSAGEVVNTIVPARCGDAVKVGLLVRAASSRSWAEIAGVLVAERVVETCVVIALVAGPAAGWLVRMGPIPAWGYPALGVAATLLVLFVARRLKMIRQFLRGLSVLGRWRTTSVALSLSFVLWIAEAMALAQVARVMGVELELAQSIAVLTLLNLAIALPIALANIGPYEAAIVVGLTVCGASLEDAVAIALVHHALQLTTLALWAAGFLLAGSRVGYRRTFVVDTHDKRRAIGHYDSLAGRYDKFVSRGIGLLLRERERGVVLELAQLREPGKSMIDVGCGGGFFALAAKTQGMRVCAVDAAPGMVAALAERVDEVKVGDVENLEMERQFDRVVCAGVLDFVLDPAIAFGRLCRLTKPGGRLVVAAPRFGLGGYLYRLEKRRVGIRVNLFTVDWFKRMAEQNGMNVIEHAYPLPNNLAVCLQPELPLVSTGQHADRGRERVGSVMTTGALRVL